MAAKQYLSGISAQALSSLEQLGSNIRDARLSRDWSVEEAASRSLMSKSTFTAIEKGKPEASIGAYLAALDIFGLASGLGDVAAPHHDEVGRRLRNLRKAKR